MKIALSFLLIAIIFGLLSCRYKENTSYAVVFISDNLTSIKLANDINIGIDNYFNSINEPYNYKHIESKKNDELQQIIATAINKNHNLQTVILLGYNFSTIVNEIALFYDHINFILINEELEFFIPNLLSLMYNDFASGRQAGMATALVTLSNQLENRVFAIVEGINSPNAIAYREGFISGVVEVLPNANFERLLLEPERDSEVVTRFIAMLRSRHGNNFFAILTTTDSATNKAISYAKELYISNESLFIIATNSDWFLEGLIDSNNTTTHSVVLTSAIKLVTNNIYDILININNSKFTGGVKQGQTIHSNQNPILRGLLTVGS
jgi:basic membrane lipoprotein Med (substrate-binding protein (PBP1-ABC) superfamily)